MFINSKKAYEFPHPDGDPKQDVKIPADYLGEIPDWVGKTRLFALAVNDRSITMVGKEKSIPAASGVSDEEKELRKKARKLKIQDGDKMPLMELVLAIHTAENPPPPPGKAEPEKPAASAKNPPPAPEKTEPAKPEVSAEKDGGDGKGGQAPAK